MNLWKRGSITDKQLRALDSFLIRFGRRRFDKFRVAVGIRPSTPNQRLSRRVAHLLLREIIGTLEAEK